MPGMYNHFDQGYSSGTTVCAVERNNKKLKQKAKVPRMPSLFCFCSAHLKLSANSNKVEFSSLSLLNQGFQGHLALFKCKGFRLNCPKPLRLPLVRRGAPGEIRIVTMAEFHKGGSFEPFLWNCAATAARINRFAVYSVDIIIDSLFYHCTGLN